MMDTIENILIMAFIVFMFSLPISTFISYRKNKKRELLLSLFIFISMIL